jgi:hypothetical protein
MMIKYLRERITGRPAVFSSAGDLPFDENFLSIKKTHSQNSLTDVMSINMNLNDDQSINQNPFELNVRYILNKKAAI